MNTIFVENSVCYSIHSTHSNHGWSFSSVFRRYELRVFKPINGIPVDKIIISQNFVYSNKNGYSPIWRGAAQPGEGHSPPTEGADRKAVGRVTRFPNYTLSIPTQNAYHVLHPYQIFLKPLFQVTSYIHHATYHIHIYHHVSNHQLL